MSRTLANRETPEKRAMLQRIGTPQPLFNYLDARWSFSLDICAEPWSAKCERFITKEQDYFKTAVDGEVCFGNPPYESIDPWVERAWGLLDYTTTCLLLPVRTDRDWFLRYADDALVTFLRGRWTMQKPPDWPQESKWSSGGFPLMTMTFGPRVRPGAEYDLCHRDQIIANFGDVPKVSVA